jgi:hypothetical protein
MQKAGLSAGQPAKIAGALDRLEADSSDVDGDGTTDIEELVDSTNPNISGDEPLKCLDAGSGDDGGCAIASAPGPRVTSEGAATLVGVVAGLYLARTRRRRGAAKLP